MPDVGSNSTHTARRPHPFSPLFSVAIIHAQDTDAVVAAAPAKAAAPPTAAAAPAAAKDADAEERREKAAAVAAKRRAADSDSERGGKKSEAEREREEKMRKQGKEDKEREEKQTGTQTQEQKEQRDREKAYTPRNVSAAAADAAATTALKRKGASKDALPAPQLAAAILALAPRVVRHKPLTEAEAARVAAAFNVSADGTLTRSQLRSLAANRTTLLFALADANGDGEVSQAEYLAYAQRDAPKGVNTTDSSVPASVTRLFDRVAGPGAATMNASAAEAAGVADAVTAFFLAADTDGSGRVSPEELAQRLPFTHPGTPNGTQPWLPLAAPMDAATILRVYGTDGDGLLDREETEELFDDTAAAALARDARPAFKLVAASLDADGNGRLNVTEVVPEAALGEGAQKARETFQKAAGKNGTLSYDQAAAELDAANKRSHDERAKEAGVKKGDVDAKALAKLAVDVPKKSGEQPVNLTDAQAAADVTRYDVAGKGSLDRVGYSLWAADTLPPKAAAAGGAPRTAGVVANVTKAGEPEPAK